jgi:hypothetical protein
MVFTIKAILLLDNVLTLHPYHAAGPDHQSTRQFVKYISISYWNVIFLFIDNDTQSNGMTLMLIP